MADSHNAVTPRTDLDLEFFRSRLMEEKTLAQQTIHGTEELPEDGTGDLAQHDELADYDPNHPADSATDLAMREQDRALIKNAQEILHKIERALAKLDDGTYGISDLSGEPIPTERLEAIPYATLTATEQARQEGLS